jgi:hypothetical protein
MPGEGRIWGVGGDNGKAFILAKSPAIDGDEARIIGGYSLPRLGDHVTAVRRCSAP